MIVMKFGGTSTQDASAMASVARIIQSKLSERPVVVISAIAQATNLLERAGVLASEGKADEAIGVLQDLFNRHDAIVSTLILDKQRQRDLNEILSNSFRELQDLVKGVTILRELTPRTLDAFYCYGELLSSRLVACALQEIGVDAVWIDTKDFMVTDENFTRAVPLMDIVEQRLPAIMLPLVQRGKVPVTQGFIGISLNGRRTTMGRESSDYSAAVIGAALNVNDIQIWTDVDGILTADPRIVPFPKKISELSFEEALELSYFGAKVLHPNTMMPAIEKNIPVYIYNSRNPQGSGTLITSKPQQGGAAVKSIAYKRDVVLLTISPKKRFGQYIFWEHIYSILTKYSVQANLTATSEYSVSIALDAKNNINGILQDLSDVGYVHVLEGKGIVCVVGFNIRNSPSLINRIFQALPKYGVTMLSFGASPSSLSFVIEDKDIPEAVRLIHQEFFE